MTSLNEQLNLKKIIGAMLFAAKKTVTVSDLKKIFAQAAEQEEDAICRQFAKIKESEISATLDDLKAGLAQMDAGIHLAEVAGGYRFQTNPACVPWLRQLLNSGRPSRLSKPTLETLAIIAYRQPVTRAEIESVRGVNVDNIVRHLLECQLIKICGRSDLPGHPLLYGTTQLFLEHFGLQDINHLPGIEQLRRKEAERIRAGAAKSAGENRDNSVEADEDIDEDEDDEDDDEDEEEQEVPDNINAGQKTAVKESEMPQKAKETSSEDRHQ
jgi:segregation and condensation protein B